MNYPNENGVPTMFGGTFIDLTHPLSSQVPSWEGEGGFSMCVIHDYKKDEISFRVQKIEMMAGIGTHIDAPAHCIKNGKTIDQLGVDELVAPCVVIDVSAQAHADFKLETHHIIDWEMRHGQLPLLSFVIIRTGWDRLFSDANRYRNQLRFPYITAEAAQHLLKKNIVGLGVDTLSPDRLDDGYPVHQAILGAGKYIVENVAHSDLLPPLGARVMILPIKIVNAVEAPVRMVAFF